ncbi:DUF192 domain-containing protein [Candidatus Parcubacteria bacterium]|nr:MAG: DUF192 domain-containing protein [Candidatus Parcubacteria bacterium]
MAAQGTGKIRNGYSAEEVQVRFALLGGSNAVVAAEVAQTLWQKMRGLAGRTSMPAGRGMLFLFPRPGRYVFWMWGMRLPLDIVWIRRGIVVHITLHAQPLQWVASRFRGKIFYVPPERVDAVLEIAAGECERIGIQRGCRAAWS